MGVDEIARFPDPDRFDAIGMVISVFHFLSLSWGKRLQDGKRGSSFLGKGWLYLAGAVWKIAGWRDRWELEVCHRRNVFRSEPAQNLKKRRRLLLDLRAIRDSAGAADQERAGQTKLSFVRGTRPS